MENTTLREKLESKSLQFTEERLSLWIGCSGPDTTTIYVTDPELSVTYDVADFDGGRYIIKHFGKFNDVFVKESKKRPQIVREVLKFHKHNNAYYYSDGLVDLKLRFSCFKRRFSIYVKKTVKKTKSLWE
jgi:hypothetical protein